MDRMEGENRKRSREEDSEDEMEIEDDSTVTNSTKRNKVDEDEVELFANLDLNFENNVQQEDLPAATPPTPNSLAVSGPKLAEQKKMPCLQLLMKIKLNNAIW